MNARDTIKQKLFPTVMAPQYEELSPCPVNQSRLLMAGSGLFIEAVKPWGKIVAQLWENARAVPLPYGHIEEHYDDFFQVLDRIGPIISSEIIGEAAAFAEKGLEWAGWIVYDGESFSYMPVPFEASRASAKVLWPNVPGYSLVADVHSHGTIPSGFSSTDDIDDSGGVRICIVLGDYKKVDGKPIFTQKIRFAIEGFFVEVDYDAERWFKE